MNGGECYLRFANLFIHHIIPLVVVINVLGVECLEISPLARKVGGSQNFPFAPVLLKRMIDTDDTEKSRDE